MITNSTETESFEKNCVVVAGNTYCDVTHFTINKDWTYYTSIAAYLVFSLFVFVLFSFHFLKNLQLTKKLPRAIIITCKELNNAAKGQGRNQQ